MSASRRAALMAAVFSLGLAASAHAETLADAVAMAYQSNPTLLNQRSTVRNADESYLRARRGFDPTVTANVSTTLSGAYNSNPAIGKNYTNLESGGVNLAASQTLYSGGRLSATVKAQEASLLSQRESLRQADQTLIQSVASAYTAVLQAQESLKIADDNITVLTRQRADAQARFDVGTQTRTDVAQAESRLAQAQATRISASNTLDNARAQYRVVVSQSPTNLQAAPDLTKLLPMSLGQAMDVAYENNPTMRSAYLAERASAANIAVAKSVNRPQVSVGVTAGYTPDIMSQRNNLGVTGSLSASIPLYTGLLTSSNVRSAQELNQQRARLDVGAARGSIDGESNCGHGSAAPRGK